MGLTGAWFRWQNGQLCFPDMVSVGDVPPNVMKVFSGGDAHLSDEERRVAYGPSPRPLELITQVLARRLPRRTSPGLERLRAAGVRDIRAAYGLDASGHGYVLCAPLRSSPALSRRDLARWSRLRAHLLAGLRLHTQPTEPEAVLAPGGKLAHAVGRARSRSAREVLREAARRVDRARSRRGRADPDAALDAWRGLVSGRWSLVDRFERDGRRYLVARPNEPVVAERRSLSAREQQVVTYAALGRSNKEIAYELGLAPSTVSTHLKEAMRRLGLPSRAALVELWVLSRAGSGS